MTSSGQTETVEILWRKVKGTGIFASTKFQFVAVHYGPEGQSNLAESPVLLGEHNIDLPAVEGRHRKIAEFELSLLVNKLLRDGWSLVGRHGREYWEMRFARTTPRSEETYTRPTSGSLYRWYEVLQVSPVAPEEVVKASYNALSKKFHPDRGGTNTAMAALNEALEEFYRERGGH